MLTKKEFELFKKHLKLTETFVAELKKANEETKKENAKFTYRCSHCETPCTVTIEVMGRCASPCHPCKCVLGYGSCDWEEMEE